MVNYHLRSILTCIKSFGVRKFDCANDLAKLAGGWGERVVFFQRPEYITI